MLRQVEREDFCILFFLVDLAIQSSGKQKPEDAMSYG